MGVRLIFTSHQTNSVGQRVDLEISQHKLGSSSALLRFITRKKKELGESVLEETLLRKQSNTPPIHTHTPCMTDRFFKSTAVTFFRILLVRKWVIHQLCKDPSFLPPFLFCFFSLVCEHLCYTCNTFRLAGFCVLFDADTLGKWRCVNMSVGWRQCRRALRGSKKKQSCVPFVISFSACCVHKYDATAR